MTSGTGSTLLPGSCSVFVNFQRCSGQGVSKLVVIVHDQTKEKQAKLTSYYWSAGTPLISRTPACCSCYLVCRHLHAT